MLRHTKRSSNHTRSLFLRQIGPNSRKKRQEQLTALMADGTETVDVIFQKATCVACHTIPGIPGAKGTIGPALEEGTNALLRMKDKDYKGSAKTVPDYIMESIVSPSAYVVKAVP